MRGASLFVLGLFLCGSAIATAADFPEDQLSCSRGESDRDKPLPASQPFTKSRPGSITRAEERARLIKSVLTPEDQARLDAAVNREQIEALALEAMGRAGFGTHQYSLTGPRRCVLTRFHTDNGYRESLCLQPQKAVAGNNGKIEAAQEGEDAFRQTITMWMLYVSCEGKACAVYTEGRKVDFMDTYFIGTLFSSDSEALFAAKALEKLAEACLVAP